MLSFHFYFEYVGFIIILIQNKKRVVNQLILQCIGIEW